MRIDHYIHIGRDDTDTILAAIHHIGAKIMGQIDDMRATLGTINQTTNEIASDVADLVTRIGTGGISEAEATEINSALTEIAGRLRGVADAYTPPAT